MNSSLPRFQSDVDKHFVQLKPLFFSQLIISAQIIILVGPNCIEIQMKHFKFTCFVSLGKRFILKLA